MKEVDFLIVGTQKGGTTALAQFLSFHPDICFAPIKEVHFFDYDRNYHQGQEFYHSFFPNYNNQKSIGEATPIYMYLSKIPPRIARYNPKMKLIVLLRNPIDRAYSHYQMELKRGWEFLPFNQAILLEPLRLLLPQNIEDERCPRRVYSYCDRGYYSRQLKTLYQHFPEEQVLILLQEDLEQNHTQTLQQVYDFLTVSPPPQLPQPQRVLAGKYQPLPPRLRQNLQSRFAPEIEALSKLIQRDLSNWLT
jgi:hypothetical protein